MASIGSFKVNSRLITMQLQPNVLMLFCLIVVVRGGVVVVDVVFVVPNVDVVV